MSRVIASEAATEVDGDQDGRSLVSHKEDGGLHPDDERDMLVKVTELGNVTPFPYEEMTLA